MRYLLERYQVWIYFGCVALGVGVAGRFSGTERLDVAINPALAAMLFFTFLQVPLASIPAGFRETRFLAALLVSNFIAIPILAVLLSRLALDDALLRLGILMVLLTPCIDYVITFAHLGRADARLLLMSTPILFGFQIILLPIYLYVFLDAQATDMISLGPFVQAFLWLIALPLALAGAFQYWADRNTYGERLTQALSLLPVPATALVLFLVVSATVPVFEKARTLAISVLPIYLAFAIIAPLIGWGIARAFGLEDRPCRAIAFSSATRNSLVVLPLALSVPGATPILPAIVVTQTLVELLAELVYIRVIPKLRKR